MAFAARTLATRAVRTAVAFVFFLPGTRTHSRAIISCNARTSRAQYRANCSYLPARHISQ